MSGTIAFLVPLPPAALRSNTRRHWTEKVKAKQAYSKAVWAEYLTQCADRRTRAAGHVVRPATWKRARIVYEWRYCGNAPDEQNLGANLKALTDILCMAPNNGLQRNNTTYLGLVEDDKGLEPHYTMTRVAHRTDEGVYVTLERLEDA